MRALVVSFVLAGCGYDDTIGRSFPPPMPGHLEARWTQALGGLQTERGDGVGVADNGDVIVVGGTNYDLGAGAWTYVTRRAATDGAALWQTAITGSFLFPSVVFGDDGDVLVCGYTTDEMFLARLDGAGNLRWQRGLPTGGVIEARHCGFGPNGQVVAAGKFRGVIDIGGGPVAGDADGDGFVVALDETGAIAWGHTRHGPGLQGFANPLPGLVDDVVIVNWELVGSVPTNTPTGSIASYAADGTLRWSSEITGSVYRMGLDRAGRLIAVIGDATRDVVLRIDPANGEVLAENRLAGATALTSTVAVAPDGLILVADLHAGVPPDPEVTIAAFDDDGRALGSTSFPSVGTSPGSSWGALKMIAASSGGLAATGDLAFGVDFGTGPVFAAGCVPYDEATNNATVSGADGFAVSFRWVAG